MSESAHFSFSSSLYDSCNLEKKNQESSAPYNWIMDTVYENKESCYQSQAPFMHRNMTKPSSSIDIESDLRNQYRLLSRCPENKFDPTKLDNCKMCDKCNEGLPCNCSHCKQTRYENSLKDCKSNGLEPEYTRMQKPCDIYFGLENTRNDKNIWSHSGEDLQDINKIQSNSYIGSNTRQLVKDAYKSQTNY